MENSNLRGLSPIYTVGAFHQKGRPAQIVARALWSLPIAVRARWSWSVGPRPACSTERTTSTSYIV